MKRFVVGNDVGSMSSVEIAELTGKAHRNVLADIRKLLQTLDDIPHGSHFESRYLDGQGIGRPCYILPPNIVKVMLNRYSGLARVPNRLQEEAALKTIEQVFGVSLLRQYKVLNYRIDGYEPDTNTAYEIDEPEHRCRRGTDSERQRRIESVLGCKFVRIKL